MNSADKTQGWDNGQTANPNGLGGVLTTRGLDNRVGAGRMNLNRAYDQFLSGTTDVAGMTPRGDGHRPTRGWDFGQVGQGTYERLPVQPAARSRGPFHRHAHLVPRSVTRRHHELQ